MKHLLTTALIATALAAPVRGDERPDWLKVTCDENEYRLYPSSMEVRASEMVRGVRSLSYREITYWGDQYVVWWAASDSYPVLSAYSLDMITPMYSESSHRRLLRITQDLTHNPVDLQSGTGPARESRAYSRACIIEGQDFPEARFTQEGLVIEND